MKTEKIDEAHEKSEDSLKTSYRESEPTSRRKFSSTDRSGTDQSSARNTESARNSKREMTDAPIISYETFDNAANTPTGQKDTGSPLLEVPAYNTKRSFRKQA